MIFENSFKDLNSTIIISNRQATNKNIGCLINMHEYIEFYYVIKGGVNVFCNGKSDWLYAGDIIFINWCQPHRSLEFLDDTEYYIVQFDLNSLSCGNFDVFQTKYVSKLITDMHLFKSFFKNDKKLVEFFEILVTEYEKNLFTSELSIQAAICNILAYIINSANTPETEPGDSLNITTIEYSKKIFQYIYVNYQTQINLDQLSKFLGISSSYMCRLFKQYTSTTIIEYVNQLRCKKAISLINEGYTMTEAAELVGFNDYAYFSKTFKRIYGVPPKDLTQK